MSAAMVVSRGITALVVSLALFLHVEARAEVEPPATGYEARCALCHDDNGFGVQRMAARLGEEFALLTRRTDLTAPFIRQVVRNGFLAMPPMSRVEVPDAELDEIIRFLTEAKPGGR